MDPARVDLWDQLNGEGIVFQEFQGLTGDGYLGTIEDLNSTHGWQFNPNLSLSTAYGGAKLEFIVATDNTNLSPIGIPNGSGIAFSVGGGVGFSAKSKNTIAISLVGENGLLLAAQNPHSVEDTFAAIMEAASH